MSDLNVFASQDFDPDEYANAILAGESYIPHSDPRSPGKTTFSNAQEQLKKEDISVAVSRLSVGVEDISKQIKNTVASHHEELLSQAASSSQLGGSLTLVRGGLNELDVSLAKLRSKIHDPYLSLQSHVSRLQKLQSASDVFRRTSRFIILARRLHAQMAEIEALSSHTHSTTHEQGEKERNLAKAALSVAELMTLLDGAPIRSNEGDLVTNSGAMNDTVPLRSIDVLAAHIPSIEDTRAKITGEMESMVSSGLKTLNQTLLASSLQTAYNLRILPELVQSLLQNVSQGLEERIRSAFDISKISKDALTKEQSSPQSPTVYRSRIRMEPTSVTAPQFAAVLWSYLEGMIQDMADSCIKVYTLEKVLKMKKDAITQINFLEEAMKVLDTKPSAALWTSLSQSLEKHSRESMKNSSFLQQTLSTGYTKLLRLFHDFFAKIAVHTDTVYTQAFQSPETILVLRALCNFESLYLSRSSNKLNEAIGQAFSGGGRAPPGHNEGQVLARVIVNELDSAKFDPILVRSVAKNVMKSLEMMLSRADGLTLRDRGTVALIGPTSTPQQVSNGQIASFLYHCWQRLAKLKDEHSEATYAILAPTTRSIQEAFERLMEPMRTAIWRELGSILAKLHRLDLGKPLDPKSGIGGSPSPYMKDLVEKLAFIRREILTLYTIGEAKNEWVVDIVKFVTRTFVLHVSIAKPLGENGKLQLTSDMTELEFALSAFLAENTQDKRGLEVIGDDYRTLRAMRHLLFLENAQLAIPETTIGLAPLIVLHHILVRSPIPLPHTLHGWQEAEYVRWIDEHSEREAWTLIESCVEHWEKVREDGGEEGREYIQLVRVVLERVSRDQK